MSGNRNAPDTLEARSRQLFDHSVDGVDMRVRSRLNQARHAALDAAARPRARLFGVPFAAPVAGVCAAALLGIALYSGIPALIHPPGPSAGQSNFEDLDIVAASEESSGETLEMLQEDADFYEWAADRSANPDGGDVG